MTAASITVRVYNQTNSVYGFWEMQGAWNEAGVTWNNAQPLSNRGDQVGSFSPTSQGGYTINLNADGVALVHRWIDSGVNDGVLIQSSGINNGIDMRSSEYGTQNQRPTLTISYQSLPCGFRPVLREAQRLAGFPVNQARRLPHDDLSIETRR